MEMPFLEQMQLTKRALYSQLQKEMSTVTEILYRRNLEKLGTISR